MATLYTTLYKVDITPKLTRDNFPVWEEKVELVLRSLGLLHIIKPEEAPYAPHRSTALADDDEPPEDGEVPWTQRDNPERARARHEQNRQRIERDRQLFEERDAAVKYFLLNNVSPELSLRANTFQYASDMFAHLESRFDQYMHIQREVLMDKYLHWGMKPNEIVGQYHARTTDLYISLGHVKSGISLRDILLTFINGLPDAYSIYKTVWEQNVLEHDAYTLDTILPIVEGVETRINAGHAQGAAAPAALALIAPANQHARGGGHGGRGGRGRGGRGGGGGRGGVPHQQGGYQGNGGGRGGRGDRGGRGGRGSGRGGRNNGGGRNVSGMVRCDKCLGFGHYACDCPTENYVSFLHVGPSDGIVAAAISGPVHGPAEQSGHMSTPGVPVPLSVPDPEPCLPSVQPSGVPQSPESGLESVPSQSGRLHATTRVCASVQSTPDVLDQPPYMAGLSMRAVPDSINSVVWLVDSACTQHVCPNRALLVDYKPFATAHKILIGKKGTHACALGVGVVYLPVRTAHAGMQCVQINDVYYVPDSPANLLSVGAMSERGIRVTFTAGQEGEGGECIITTATGDAPVLTTERMGRLWCVRAAEGGCVNVPQSDVGLVSQHVTSQQPHTSSQTQHLHQPQPQPATLQQDATQQLQPTQQSCADSESHQHSDADLHVHTEQPVALMAARKGAAARKASELWHRRLGHLGYDNVARLTTMVDGMVPVPGAPPEGVCGPCAIGKQSRPPFPSEGSRAQAPMDLVHIDVCGPLDPPGYDGSKFFVTFVDDYSGYSIVKPVRSKADVPQLCQDVLLSMQTLAGAQLQRVRTDRGGEFTAGRLKAWLADRGILHEFTCPYTSQQNGCVERCHRTIMDRTRSLLAEAPEVPFTYWPLAVDTASYLRNRSPYARHECTPMELFTGERPNISHLRVWGCITYVGVPASLRGKLDPRARCGRLVGYCSASKGFRILVDGKVQDSRDVVFDEVAQRMPARTEQRAPDRDARGALGIWMPDEVGVLDLSPTLAQPSPQQTSRPSTQQTSQPSSQQTSQQTSEHSAPHQHPSPDQHVLPVAPHQDLHSLGADTVHDNSVFDDGADSDVVDDGEWYSADASDASSIYDDPAAPEQPQMDAAADEHFGRAVTRGLGPWTTRDRRQPDRYVPQAFVAAQPPEVVAGIAIPRTYKEAMASPQCDMWMQAMNEELASLAAHNTWELSVKPSDQRVLPVKWVFALKTTPDRGEIIRFKARLVVVGYMQTPGVDCPIDLYAPTAKPATLRALLAVVALRDMQLQQLDITTAFLNGTLEETVYVSSPPGFSNPDGRVYKLLRSLYGLKQAPKQWFRRLSGALAEIGFRQSVADPGLFLRTEPDGTTTYLLVHVDDMLVATATQAAVQRLVSQLNAQFKVKDLGAASVFLGMEIHREPHKITLTQTQYINQLIERFGLQTAAPKDTPMSVSTRLVLDMEQPITAHPYRELVGALLYLATNTRPDIAHALGVLSRHMHHPTDVAYGQAKHVLKYLAGDVRRGLVFQGTATDLEGGVTGYCDADYAGDVTTRKSTTAYVFRIANTAVAWKSKLQPVVAHSTTESEYISAASAAKEALWLRKLMPDLGVPVQSVPIQCDNLAALHIIEHGDVSDRTKHIDVAHHFIRDRVARGELQYVYVATNENVADILTKPLPRDKFVRHREGLGVW